MTNWQNPDERESVMAAKWAEPEDMVKVLREALGVELRAWLRDNLVLEAALVDPHKDDVRITLRIKDEDDPFAEAIVWMPEKYA